MSAWLYSAQIHMFRLAKIPTKNRLEINSTSQKTAYVPQQAWIHGATVEENITFRSKLGNATFEKVRGTCALEADLETLPDGAACRA